MRSRISSLVADVAIERGGSAADGGGDSANGCGFDAFGVGDLDGDGGDLVAAEGGLRACAWSEQGWVVSDFVCLFIPAKNSVSIAYSVLICYLECYCERCTQ